MTEGQINLRLKLTSFFERNIQINLIIVVEYIIIMI